ncbi:MAG TPA: sorbosone dehydrogenase family protein [Xanthobacteraceae bacterium]|nr:sorbosone dehydrogenase family protein [Xanthobacteraceae bacterium]
MHQTVRIATAAAFVLAGAVSADAQNTAPKSQDSAGPALKGKAALGDWKQDKPGLRRLLTAADQPPIGEDAKNFSETAPMPEGASPKVPPGFIIEKVASGLKAPRVIRTAPNGDLFVAEKESNSVRVLRVPSGTARPEINEVFASGLSQPYGIAFYPAGANPEWIYVANDDGVVRFRYKSGDTKASGEPEQIVKRIPWTHHWTRDIAFTPDNKLLLAVGSGSNVALDMFPTPLTKGGLEAWKNEKPLGAAWDTEERRAVVMSYDPDGKNEKIVATGLRNCSGLAIHPTTKRPWCVVNERDGIGDNTPFEYATEVKEGAFYGWPWYYLGGHEDPRQKGARPDLKDKLTAPDVLIQAHSAPLQITFYQGDSFPAAYKGSAFVTLHGSWNRAQRTGYKVVRLVFDSAGKPTGEYEDFITGFVIDDKKVWGRPVGVTVAQDGSLFVTEDGSGGTIWRVSRQRTAAN